MHKYSLSTVMEKLEISHSNIYEIEQNIISEIEKSPYKGEIFSAEHLTEDQRNYIRDQENTAFLSFCEKEIAVVIFDDDLVGILSQLYALYWKNTELVENFLHVAADKFTLVGKYSIAKNINSELLVNNICIGETVYGNPSYVLIPRELFSRLNEIPEWRMI